jgi:MFS-type transporter involved in bile tolerance (Atg22 family)
MKSPSLLTTALGRGQAHTGLAPTCGIALKLTYLAIAMRTCSVEGGPCASSRSVFGNLGTV